ncbi:hypothetical protein KC19_VG324900 [Ceratodon purpureus]|uniref:Uncharacterized protein n=1 Tax=Ceratodon purpureus TaxID=3225 RepID=A0A8T0HWY5_CERPU|nr:hypothetical protein KC19_VG324900 [Ceratodon purpureus]
MQIFVDCSNVILEYVGHCRRLRRGTYAIQASELTTRQLNILKSPIATCQIRLWTADSPTFTSRSYVKRMDATGRFCAINPADPIALLAGIN